MGGTKMTEYILLVTWFFGRIGKIRERRIDGAGLKNRVGIDNEYDLADAVRQRHVDGGDLAASDGKPNRVGNQPLASQLLDDGPHAIRRSVVHRDDLLHVKRLRAGAYRVGFVWAGRRRPGRT